MSISIQAKTDYSSLFKSLNTSSTGSNLTTSVLGGTSDMTSLLTDYAAIKNGSYSKLVKAAYAKNASESTKASSSTETKDESTEEEKKDILTINGKEIDVSDVDLSKSKVPDKSKTVYSSDATYNTTGTTGDLFNSLV